LRGCSQLEFRLALADTTAESETSVKFRIAVCGGSALAGMRFDGASATDCGVANGRVGAKTGGQVF
jgi:hypothetical protein